MGIVRSELELYTDAALTNMVADVVQNDSINYIILDENSMGNTLDAGKAYFARVYVTNDVDIDSAWSPLYRFCTYPYISSIITADNLPHLSTAIEFDSNSMNIQKYGIRWSENLDGSQSVVDLFDGPVTPNTQLTDYLYGMPRGAEIYYVPVFYDTEGRYYEGDWDSELQLVQLWYEEPTVVIDSVSTTATSITVTATSTGTNPNVSDMMLRVNPTQFVRMSVQGSPAYGTYTVTVEDGDLDIRGNAITISPGTTYNLTVFQYVNTYGNYGQADFSVTTAPSAFVSVDIDVTEITSSRIYFTVDIDTDDTGVYGVTVQYKKNGTPTWNDFQVDDVTGVQGPFGILAQPNTTYTIYAYAEDLRGTNSDSQTITVTTPAS